MISDKTKKIIQIVMIAMVVLLGIGTIIYLAGVITQALLVYLFKKQTRPDFSVLACYISAFDFKYSRFSWTGIAVMAICFLAYLYSVREDRGKMDSGIKSDKNRNFKYSGKETYGSARQMTESEMRKKFQVVKSNVKGMERLEGSTVFGFLNDKKRDIVAMPVSDWKKGTDFNRNVAVCGPPGSNKTRGFVMNYIIQKIVGGESIVVVDTKGELYAKTKKFAEKHHYKCKILNLIELTHSDGWDILNEVKNDPEMAQELASTIIRNTTIGEKTDAFWDVAEQNILKAVILLKSVGKADISNVEGKSQTMGDVYEYIATRKVTTKEGGGESMEADFNFLRASFPSHPAITPFLQFMNAGDLCGKILHGLGNRLQLFQNRQLSNVLGTKDIDLLEAGNSKCIYYLRFSDQTSTYSFITALFFAFLAVRLVKFADGLPTRELPVPVNLVLDEFCNIGAIPDFERKMATFRSRMINVVLIYQNNMLFETTYPNKIWEAILATCDTFLVLGVGNETTTANYVSELTGEATTSVSSASLSNKEGRSELRTTSSEGRRYVWTADEVRNLDPSKALLFVRTYRVTEIVKMDYSENPVYLNNRKVFDNEESVTDHKSIVTVIEERYDDYVIDGIVRDAYKNSVSSDSSINEDKGHNDSLNNNTTSEQPAPAPQKNNSSRNKPSKHIIARKPSGSRPPEL